MIQDKDNPKQDAILRVIQMQRDGAQDMAALLAGDVAQLTADLSQSRQDNTGLREELRNAKDRLRGQQDEIEKLRPRIVIENPAQGGEVVSIGAVHG